MRGEHHIRQKASASRLPTYQHWLWLPYEADKSIMPYQERLYPWVLVRLLPKMQRLTVGQFRTRSHADGH